MLGWFWCNSGWLISGQAILLVFTSNAPPPSSSCSITLLQGYHHWILERRKARFLLTAGPCLIKVQKEMLPCIQFLIIRVGTLQGILLRRLLHCSPTLSLIKIMSCFFNFKRHLWKLSPCVHLRLWQRRQVQSMLMVQILCPAKIYRFNNWHMCFPRQEEDNVFYQCLIHDAPPLQSRFVFDLHKYFEAAMKRAFVTAWVRFPALKEHPLSLDQNPWVLGQGMATEL